MLDKYRYKGRHRAPSSKGRAAARVLTAGALLTAPAMLPPLSAQAAGDATWDRLAQCESGGNWSIDTGNGYQGGLQFSPRTWTAFGGGEFAPHADQASREQQIVVAERVLAAQGWNAWPACSRKLGIRGEPATPRSAPPATPGPRVSAARSAAPQSAPTDHYTIQAGDTLCEIAAAHNTTWRALWSLNRDVVGDDPDLILIGAVLRVG